MTLLAVTACGNYRADDSECSLDGPPIALPGALCETSGVAAGIRNPSLVWTHNDRGRGPVLSSESVGGSSPSLTFLLR